jgi:rubrerythrin
MASTFEFLTRAERLERVAEAFYRALAERYEEDATLRDLFARLAREEEQHASRIRLLTQRHGHDRQATAMSAGALEELDRLIATAEGLLGEVQAGGWDGSGEQALARSAELERLFCLSHAQVLISQTHPELKAFFERLAQQDAAHRKLLTGG